MINLVRPFLHIFRVMAHKLLGITTVPRSVSLRLDRLLDRVLLLESHVNWRLNGLPSQLGNVRLEQLALASGTALNDSNRAPGLSVE